MIKTETITKKIFKFDTGLNWTIGLALLILPAVVDRLIFIYPVINRNLYLILGLIFVFFAFWQSIVIYKDRICRSINLIFAALMAVGPVILLTQALIVFQQGLYILSMLILWLANFYMLLLTALYITTLFILTRSKK